MRCRECAEAKKYADGSRYCRQYGIIIREDHICIRDGHRKREEETEDNWEAIDALEERRKEDGALGMADSSMGDR